jgi:hypothetical protein
LLGNVDIGAHLKGSVTMDAHLWIGEDNGIEFAGLKDRWTDSYIDGAIMTAQLKTDEEVAIGDAVTMSYLSGTNGRYRAIMDAQLFVGLVEHQVYFVDVTIDVGDYHGLRRIVKTAEYHAEKP